jgi:polysaccharide pyruvyl transferase WcaK-like protein
LGGEDVTSFQVGDMQTVGVAPRSLGKDKEIVPLFGSLCRMLFEAKFMPVLIEMDREHDAAILNEIDKSQGGKVPSIRKVATVPQLQQRISRMDSLISMRLHAGVLGAGVGVPALMLAYDPKVASFAQQIELPCLNIQGLTAQRIMDNFLTFQKSRERHVKTLERKLDELQKMASENIRVLAEAVPSIERATAQV